MRSRRGVRYCISVIVVSCIPKGILIDFKWLKSLILKSYFSQNYPIHTLGMSFQISSTIRRWAASEPSIYRWVVDRFECPASIWTSRRDPPTVDIFLAAFVMNVLRPEWLEQPFSPRLWNHREKRFTTIWADALVALSVVTT